MDSEIAAPARSGPRIGAELPECVRQPVLRRAHAHSACKLCRKPLHILPGHGDLGWAERGSEGLANGRSAHAQLGIAFYRGRSEFIPVSEHSSWGGGSTPTRHPTCWQRGSQQQIRGGNNQDLGQCWGVGRACWHVPFIPCLSTPTS